MAKIKHNNFRDTIDEVIANAKHQGVIHLYAEGANLKGRKIRIGCNEMLHFGTTGYLGLEQDIRLKDAASKALYAYGTQFPLSKTYISHPLYAALEDKIYKMYQNPIIITKNSTLGHLAVIPTVVNDDDVVILDHQVHWSVQSAAQMLKIRNIPVEMIRHNNLNMLESKIKEYAGKAKKIWFMADGVYSMFGDFVPVNDLMVLSKKYPQLQLYIDDVHGMSWRGKNGIGFFADNFETIPENCLIFGTLSKSFGASGAVLVCPDKKRYNQIKNFGGPLTFSAQLEPASVAAAIAAANIHLSDEIYSLQNQLSQKINFFNKLLQNTALPLVDANESPVFYIGTGLPDTGYNFVKRLMNEGFFVNLGLFPAVPVKNTGVRITIARHNKKNDIKELVNAMNYHFPKALEETETTSQRVFSLFKLKTDLKVLNTDTHSEINLFYTENFNEMDMELWDNTIGKQNGCDATAIRFLQKVFTNNKDKEHNWKFHFYCVTDQLKKPILLTFFTSAIWKDDMLAPVSVSEKMEVQRKNDRYYATAVVMAMGSIFNEGEQHYTNKKSKYWKQAWKILLRHVENTSTKTNSKITVLRDFMTVDDELNNFLVEKGFVKMQMPDACIMQDIKWSTEMEFINQLSKRAKRHFKKDIQPYRNLVESVVVQKLSDEHLIRCYEIYKNVKENNLALNTFTYPIKLFKLMNSSKQWEFITLYKKGETLTTQNLIGVMFCYTNKNRIYIPALVGLDYSFNNEYQTYRQLLFLTISRAIKQKLTSIDFGISASFEKKKLGAQIKPMWAYVQTDDNFILERLETIR